MNPFYRLWSGSYSREEDNAGKRSQGEFGDAERTVVRGAAETQGNCLKAAGMLYKTEYFGRRAWYNEGAAHILKTQNQDGSWGTTSAYNQSVWDTCFAILFLKRSTRNLDVASVPRFYPGK